MICECEDRQIHRGRFQRCRKHATARLRVADTRTLRDVVNGQAVPVPGSWCGYCAECATAIARKRGTDVEREYA